jgi:hypothetical protein
LPGVLNIWLAGNLMAVNITSPDAPLRNIVQCLMGG